MCDPLSATALALTAGGSFLESKDANKNAKRVMNAKNDAYETGMITQRRHADEAGGALSESTQNQGRETFDERNDQESDRIKNAFANTRVQPDYNTGLTSSAPKNVITARQDASDKAGAETDRDVNAFSRLGGYKGASFNQGLDRNKFAQLFGNTQSRAGGDMRLLPIEMESAGNNASKGPALFPQLLKLGGSALGMYGAGGGSFSNTIEGPVSAGAFGPGVPQTSYGLFQNGKPMQAFGSQVVF